MRDLHPHVRRVLIVGRGEWSNAHPAVEAMRTGQAESYVFVPWVLRERWLYLPVSELLADWEAAAAAAVEVVRIVGEEWEPRSHELRDVFARIGIPFGFYGARAEQARRDPGARGPDVGRLPVVAFAERDRCSSTRPTSGSPRRSGFSTEPEAPWCDLVIIGGGPAGSPRRCTARPRGWRRS